MRCNYFRVWFKNMSAALRMSRKVYMCLEVINYMNIKTKPHFKRLREIVKEDGLVSALDYDYQITRSRHPLMNWIMEDVEYLKAPDYSTISGSPARDDFQRVHHSKHYTVTYSGAIFNERLEELQLK